MGEQQAPGGLVPRLGAECWSRGSWVQGVVKLMFQSPLASVMVRSHEVTGIQDFIVPQPVQSQHRPGPSHEGGILP